MVDSLFSYLLSNSNDDTPDGFLFLSPFHKFKDVNYSYRIKVYSGHLESDFVGLNST
jgi:hypothetical protein